MAIYYEVTCPDGGFPINVWNDSTATIPAGYAVLFEDVTGQARSVKLPGAGTGTARLAGITKNDILPKSYGPIIFRGPAKLIGHAPIAVGEFVQASDIAGHEGEGIVGVVTATAAFLGQCLTECAADGDTFVVDVNIHNVSKAAP